MPFSWLQWLNIKHVKFWLSVLYIRKEEIIYFMSENIQCFMSSQVSFAYNLILILWYENVSLLDQQWYSWGFWAICWTIPLFSSLTSDLFNVKEAMLLLGGWINTMKDVRNTNHRQSVQCFPLMWAADSLWLWSKGCHFSYIQWGPSSKLATRKSWCCVCSGNTISTL